MRSEVPRRTAYGNDAPEHIASAQQLLRIRPIDFLIIAMREEPVHTDEEEESGIAGGHPQPHLS